LVGINFNIRLRTNHPSTLRMKAKILSNVQYHLSKYTTLSSEIRNTEHQHRIVQTSEVINATGVLLLAIRTQSQGSGFTAAIRLIVHPVS
jgi:hypothetical protein